MLDQVRLNTISRCAIYGVAEALAASPRGCVSAALTPLADPSLSLAKGPSALSLLSFPLSPSLVHVHPLPTRCRIKLHCHPGMSQVPSTVTLLHAESPQYVHPGHAFSHIPLTPYITHPLPYPRVRLSSSCAFPPLLILPHFFTSLLRQLSLTAYIFLYS